MPAGGEPLESAKIVFIQLFIDQEELVLVVRLLPHSRSAASRLHAAFDEILEHL